MRFSQLNSLVLGIFVYLCARIPNRVQKTGTTVAHDINGCRHVALDFFYIVRISLLSSFLHIRVPIIVKIMVNNKAALA